MYRSALAFLTVALLMPACDFSGDFLFPEAVDGIPGIAHLGVLEPVAILNSPNAKAAVAATPATRTSNSPRTT